MLKYYAGGSIILLFIILGIFYKSNYRKGKENHMKTDEFEHWGQFIPLDE